MRPQRAGLHRWVAICGVLATSFVQAASEAPPVSFTASEQKRIIAHGPWPVPVPADPGNPLSGNSRAEALGAKLFRNPALSRDGKIACISCHLPARGFADGLPKANGLQTHTRNTQGLFNIGLQRWFGWDGGADSLWAAALRPMLSPIEMGASISQVASVVRADSSHASDYKALTGKSLPLPSDTADQAVAVFAAQAIGAWVRTLTSGPTAFDRFGAALAAGDDVAARRYPQAARRGLKLFVGEARCHVCHYGPNFSNGEFHDIGRPFIVSTGKVDPGRYRGIQRVRDDPFNLLGRFSSHAGDAAGPALKTRWVRLTQIHWGQWRTPSLRNLTLTPPYMHDGSLVSLRDVVSYYVNIDPARLHTNGEAILRPMDLSERDVDDLVAFLKSLSPE